MASVTAQGNTYQYEWVETYISNSQNPELGDVEMTFRFVTNFGTALLTADSEEFMLEYIKKDEERFVNYLKRASR
jgi:hypothetical protein